MKRVHVLEFEDLQWFPGWLRTALTNVIVVFSRALGVTPVLAQLVSRALEQQRIDQIVDLGSGGGGVMPDVLERLRAVPATSSAELTPFVRPLTLRQLFFTYVIPLVPIFYAWDGQASMPRLYTADDIDELLEGLDSPTYRWEKGGAPTEKGKTLGTYLLGMPTSEESPA